MRERELAAEIERWFELEADEVAACPTDPAVCRRPHVMEEAVRPEPGGPILACTVNGRVLAEKLAAHLMAVSQAEEERMRRLAGETFPVVNLVDVQRRETTAEPLYPLPPELRRP